MSAKSRLTSALKIIAWVKTWKTWHEGYDERVALAAVVTRLEDNPELMANLRYYEDMPPSEKKIASSTRYALGVIAIEAARDAHPEADAIRAEHLARVEAAKAEWQAQREAERQAKELDAELFLLLSLADRPVLYRELEREAREVGINAYYLRSARANLGVFTIEGPTPADPRLWVLPEWSRA